MCSFYISLVGKFQWSSAGKHLLFLVNKMPIIKFIPEMWLGYRKQILSLFSRILWMFPLLLAFPRTDQRQRGAEEKEQVKEGAGNKKFFSIAVSQRHWGMKGKEKVVAPRSPAWCAGSATSKDPGGSRGCFVLSLWWTRDLHFCCCGYRQFQKQGSIWPLYIQLPFHPSFKCSKASH